MMSKFNTMTKKELGGYFKFYREAFPTWGVEHSVVLVRREGLLKQCMAFEALRDGAYRPSCSIELQIKPNVQLLFSYLDVKHREVRPREHSLKCAAVLAAMEQQFRPSIRRPLEISDVIKLCEFEVEVKGIVTLNNIVGLATLNASVDAVERATACCQQVASLLAARANQVTPWELEQGKYIAALLVAIRGGTHHEFLSGF